MKELIRGIIATIAAIIVFSATIAVGAVFNIFYPFVMAFKERSIVTFFKIWWRLIDGTLATIGNFLYDGFAVHYDELGNVWGEWIEDAITKKEKTRFGDKNITISASVGQLEKDNIPMFKRGHGLSKALNWAFRERRHAIGAWEKWLAYKEIQDRNLHGKL